VDFEHVTVGTAPSPAAPKKIYAVAKNRFLRSDIHFNKYYSAYLRPWINSNKKSLNQKF